MGIGVAKPLGLKRAAARPVPLDVLAKPRRRVGVNALLGMGLWVLLWLGYNTNLGHRDESEFPCQYHGFDPRRKGLFPDAGRMVCFVNDLRTIKPPVSLDHGSPGVDLIVHGHRIGFFRDPIARPDLCVVLWS